METTLAHADGPPLTHLDELIWIGSIARLGAARCPDREAIIFPDRGVRLSYRDLDRQSDAFAQLLRTHGLRAGDRVAYLGRNSDLFFPVLFGAIRAGVVLVPINWRLAAPEVAFQLNDSETRLLLCDPDLLVNARAAVAGLAQRPEILPTERGTATPGLHAPPAHAATPTVPSSLSSPTSSTLLVTESVAEAPGLRELLQNPPPSAASPPAPLPTVADQAVLHLYTSGTTGHPKGVLISHHALSIARHSELISQDFALLTPGGVSLSAMPNFHVGGMSWVLMGLVRLGTIVLTANPTPANMLALLTEYRVESSFIVPTVIRGIVDEIKSKQCAAPALAGMYYGAMTIGAGLLRETMDLLGCSFGQFFGMTEITGAATFLPPQDHDLARPHLLASVGKAYPGMSIEIRDPDRRVLNTGEHGEIWIRSPTRMLGYWRLPEATRQTVVDGWYATGDGGYLDREGYLYLTDRIKDMIVSGGENVYPAEVEEVLRAHPAVLDAACVGIPHAVWGESVAAVLELRPGQSVTKAELREFTRSRMAGYKCPKQFQFAQALPRTASGKVKRAELRLSLRHGASESTNLSPPQENRSTMNKNATLSFDPGAVIVAGGSGGIGEGIARRFAAAGVPVLITYHSSETKALAVKAGIEGDGGSCDHLQVNLADSAQVDRLFAHAKATLGRIAHVVYAAGPSFEFNFIGAIPLDEWHRVVNADINGAFHLIRHAANLFKDQGAGNLAAVITSAVERVPLRDIMSAAPKAAIEMLVKGVAKEYGRYGVRANCVGPGWINAGLGKQALDEKLDEKTRESIRKQTIPLQRFGTAQDIGWAALFLCSQQADFITGQTLAVDGGAQI